MLRRKLAAIECEFQKPPESLLGYALGQHNFAQEVLLVLRLRCRYGL